MSGIIKAMVMSAGVGSRLDPLTKFVPKPLVPIANRPVMDILFENEYVKALQFTAHGGLFKVQGAAQQILSDALNTPVSVMKTAGEGGAWGMSILAAYMADGGKEELPDWLENKVFANMKKQTVTPLKDGVKGFDDYMKLYKTGLSAQRKLEEVK